MGYKVNEDGSITRYDEGAYLRCHSCGAEISKDSKFCPKCGEPSNNVRRCPQCGAKVPEDALYCPECGYKLITISTAFSKVNDYRFVDLGVGIQWAYSNLGTKHSHKSGPPYHNRPRLKNELEGCRLPNMQEWQALIDGCNYKWIKDNSTYEFKSKMNGRILCVKCGIYWIGGTGKGIIIDEYGIRFTTDRGDAHIRLVKDSNI